MDGNYKDGQSAPPKTPEQIRADRIAGVDDPQVRQELEKLAAARNTELSKTRERQEEVFAQRATELRDLKLRNARAPQLTPPGTRSPYLGPNGFALATRDAELQIRAENNEYLRKIAKDHNNQIDQRLDAHRDNQAARDPSVVRLDVSQRGPATKPGEPDYAKIIDPNIANRAKELDAERQRNQEHQREQKRHRGPQR
jgi:hypothetical protein